MEESEQIIRRYLLGELSESEQSALEEKYFRDRQVFNQLLKTESELVDDYARDRLPKETRERIEQFYMAHPARADRVKFAEALTMRIDQSHLSVTRIDQPRLTDSWWQRLLASLRGQSPTLKVSMALATLLIVMGSIWFFVERERRQREAAQAQAAYEAQQKRERERSQQVDEQREREEELAAERERIAKGSQQTTSPSPAPKSALQSVSLALIAGGVRGGNGGQIPTLVISPETTQAQLLLNLKENSFPTYRATLQTISGVQIFSQTNIKPRRATSGANFTFIVSANKLASGDYVLTLRGVSVDGEVEDLSKSLFRVDKK